MSENDQKDTVSTFDSHSLPIIGGLILFSVILGTTKLGFIPVPTEAKHATTMHLPTIIASLVEGWPIGLVLGAIFGITSMYSAGSPMAQDPMIAIVPRLLVGITPYLVYIMMRRRNEYLRLGLAAVVGTFTNTILFLGLAVIKGFMPLDKAVSVGLTHGVPEAAVAVLITIPAVFMLRRAKSFLGRIDT